MLILVGGETLDVVFQEELAEKRRVVDLHGNKPRQHHGEIKNNPRPPERAVQDGPLPAQKRKRRNDHQRQKRCHRPLCQRRQSGEEVDVVEPEFGTRLVPCVPAQQANCQGRGHLHVRRRTAGKADDSRARHRDQRRVQVPSRPESSHMQVDESHHDEGEGGRGQPSAPVRYAEVLKKKHGPPVVKRRLFQPWMAIKIGGYAGGKPILQRVCRVEAAQHLMRNLRVAGFVRAHQAQTIAAQVRRHSIKQKEDGESKKDRHLGDGGPAGQPFSPTRRRVRRRGFQGGFHFQGFSGSDISWAVRLGTYRANQPTRFLVRSKGCIDIHPRGTCWPGQAPHRLKA